MAATPYTSDMPDTPITNPLEDLHRQTDAEFQAYGDTEIVTHFGAPPVEYAAIHKNCALMDWSQRGILELSGPDRLPFLNNLLTNQTWNKETKTGLAAGEGVYAFLLNTKGRIEADMNVLELGEKAWLEMDARLVEPVRQVLDRHLFAEKVKLTSRVGELHEIALQGPGARAIVEQTVGGEIGEVPLLGLKAFNSPEGALVVWRDDPVGVPGYFVVADAPIIRRLWTELWHRFETGVPGRRDLRPIGWAAWNAARVEAGRALFGIDFDSSILPAETGRFDQAVSVTKGCYLGQEIVARMYARKVVAKQLVGLRIDSGELPMAGTKIFDDKQNEIGGVTSSTISPLSQNAAIAIGLVKRGFFEPGTKVHIPAEGAMREAMVVKMPFLHKDEG
jgi:folate-binding protein YgfZ